MENTEPFDVREPLILLSLGRSHQRGVNPYEAARFAWKIDRARAGRYGLVLAHSRGIVVGAFRPEGSVKSQGALGVASSERGRGAARDLSALSI